MVNLLILDGAKGRESGESVSLLSRTPKARASRQFLVRLRQLSLFPTITIVFSERDIHSTVLGRAHAHDWIFCTLFNHTRPTSSPTFTVVNRKKSMA